MADIIDPSEIMFTPFEPKVKNRFIMYIEGIPAYLIRAAARPTITFEEIELNHINVKRYVKGKGSWEPLEITLYDPIVPSGAQAVMEWVRLHKESVTGRDGYSDFYKKDVTFNVLGPVGDKVEEWTLKGSMIQSANFGDMNFETNEPNEIILTLRYDYAILQFYEDNMSFLREMLSSDAKISSKRFVGFAAFFMLICSWGADTFSAFEVKDKILECFMYISVVGLGVTAAEKFGKK